MIDITQPIYFYDDRGRSDISLKCQKILFSDNDHCICESFAIQRLYREEQEDISQYQNIVFKVVFNLETREVYSPDFQFWLATNEED